jgi:hypothetical protein
MTSTPEGFLVAHNVPVSRAGWYDYMPHEIGVTGATPVRVYRPPEEVFSPGAIASFEGKPLTDDHPPKGVSPQDARLYVKGSTQNVRRGTGDDADLLLADLIVYDENLIREIRDGKREVSAGYECEYEPQDDGTYIQRAVVGNHVAVVDQGRAGDRVKIYDRLYTRKSVTQDMTNEDAAKKYGISEKKDGHRTPPEGYPSDREQYADPVNYKYPLNGAHARDAIDYYNRPGERDEGEYTTEEWAKIGRRIVDACNRQDGGGYEIKDGRILTPDDRKRKGNDSMSIAIRLPNRKQSRVTDFLAAIGLKQFAADAEPEELMDAVDAMAEEKGAETEEEARAHEREGMEKKDGKDAPDDSMRISNMEKKMDELMDMIKGIKDGKTGDKSAEDLIDDAINGLTDSAAGEEESHTIDPALIEDEAGVVLPESERPKDALTTVDAAYKKRALAAMKPILAAIPDPAARKQAADAAVKSIMGATGANTYAQIARRKAADAKKATAQAVTPDMTNLGREWAAKFNPHYKAK